VRPRHRNKFWRRCRGGNFSWFPSQGPLYCPQVVNFSRSVKKCWCHSCQGFCKLDRYSSCLTIFLVLESNLIFQRWCLFKSNCWNEIREMSFFEKTFWKSSFFIKDPTHIIRNIQSFDCHVFWKQKLTRCKTKMVFVFHGSLYPF